MTRFAFRMPLRSNRRPANKRFTSREDNNIWINMTKCDGGVRMLEGIS
jgi:hypothetical protein